jgi:hypothetical protein
VALLVLLGVLVERATTTDTKRVRQTLEQAAAGPVANNAAQVDPYIVPGPDGNGAREKTRWALNQGEFHAITINNLDVKFNYQTSPPTAETSFTVFVRGKIRGGLVEDELSRPVSMEVKLRKESGRWLIYGEPQHDVHD